MPNLKMDSAKLLENTILCYLSLTKIQEWLKENNLWKKDFGEIRKQWQEINSYKMVSSDTTEKQIAEPETNLSPLKNLLLEKLSPISFFVDTELLMIEQDIVLLQVADENIREYLTKTYSLKDQEICQKIFGESKHLILLTKKQWNLLNNKPDAENKQTKENLSSSCLVLFKDEATAKNKLAQWLETL